MTADVITAAREALGPVGAYLPLGFTSAPPADLQRAAVGRLERAGFGTAWTNEVIGGRDALVNWPCARATERMAFGTGIANIWARQPQTMHAAAACWLRRIRVDWCSGWVLATPSRRRAQVHEFGRPGDHARLPSAHGRPDLAACGRCRLSPDRRRDGSEAAGARRRARGRGAARRATPTFTAQARQVLGPDKLLVVGLTVIADRDADRAKDVARQTVSANLGRTSYAATMAGLGFPDRELAEVSDRMVDQVVAHGGPEAIATKVREHLTAGADHVALMLPMGTELATGVDQLEWLAPALVGAG